MPRKPHADRQNRIDHHSQTLPPQLFALGALCEGRHAVPSLVRIRMACGLVDAEDILSTVVAAERALPENPAFDLILRRHAASEEYKAIVKRAGDNELISLIDDVSNDALYMGIALAFRFLGGAR
jgi:hypothetical protein